MSDFLILLCATTLSGTLLFFFISILDKRFTNRIKARQFYFIMKLSLLYFLLPGIFSIVSILNSYPFKIKVSQFTDPITGLPNFIINLNLDVILADSLLSTTFIFLKILFYLWIAGSIITIFIRGLYRLYNLHRLFQTCTAVTESSVWEIAEKAASQSRISRKFTIYKTSCISSPFLIGCFIPRLVLPDLPLSTEELEIIFCHEFTHYKSHDIIFRSLVGIIQGINWFNPAVSMFSRIFYHYGELTCDEKVTRRLDRTGKKIYANLLVKLHDHSPAMAHTADFAGYNRKFLEKRIRVIMKENKTSHAVGSALIALSIVLCCPLISLASCKGATQLHHMVVSSTLGDRYDRFEE